MAVRASAAAGARTALLCAAVLASPVAAARLVEPGPPELEIEAPAELAAAAGELAAVAPERLAAVARLVGLADPGAPIAVELVPEHAALARATPPWIAGFAEGALGRIVLFPARAARYPHGSLEELLRHEVAHVLVARAAAHAPVPRWFDEGLALVAGDRWSLDDRSHLALALVLEDELPLAAWDARFAGSRGEVARAYAVAGAFVRFQLARFGPGLPAAVLGRLAVGLDFGEAFRRSTGVELAGVEAAFRRRHSLLYRWLPILSSSLVLWLAITALALLAGGAKARRRRALEAAWDAEEAARRAPPPPPPGGWVH